MAGRAGWTSGAPPAAPLLIAVVDLQTLLNTPRDDALKLPGALLILLHSVAALIRGASAPQRRVLLPQSSVRRPRRHAGRHEGGVVVNARLDLVEVAAYLFLGRTWSASSREAHPKLAGVKTLRSAVTAIMLGPNAALIDDDPAHAGTAAPAEDANRGRPSSSLYARAVGVGPSSTWTAWAKLAKPCIDRSLQRGAEKIYDGSGTNGVLEIAEAIGAESEQACAARSCSSGTPERTRPPGGRVSTDSSHGAGATRSSCRSDRTRSDVGARDQIPGGGWTTSLVGLLRLSTVLGREAAGGGELEAAESVL